MRLGSCIRLFALSFASAVFAWLLVSETRPGQTGQLTSGTSNGRHGCTASCCGRHIAVCNFIAFTAAYDSLVASTHEAPPFMAVHLILALGSIFACMFM